MTPQEETIYKTLRKAVSPRLAMLYRALLNAVANYNQDSPSAETDLLALCHYGREFMNSFPEMISEQDQSWPSHSGEEQGAINNLKNTLKASPFSYDRINDDTQFATVSPNQARALARLSNALANGSKTSAEKASYAVVGYNDQSNPALITWNKTLDFFMGYTHFRRNKAVDLPPKLEITNHINNLNSAIESRFGFFYKSKHSLDLILEKANKEESGVGYSVPAIEDIHEALSHIADGNMRKMFYSGLDNPNWLEALSAVGAFTNTPELDEEGKFYQRWPEAVYLKKMAQTQPETVACILKESAKSDNPHVRTAIIEIASVLPDGHLFDVAKLIACWAKEGYLIESYFWHIDEVLGLVQRLVNSGNNHLFKLGVQLSYSLFEPRIKTNENRYPTEIIALIDPYSYSDKLDLACEVLGEHRALSFCSRQLSTLTKNKESNNQGTSAYWLPSIADACSHKERSIENALVAKEVKLIELHLEREEAIDKMLLNKKVPIISRCALHAVTKALSDGKALGSYVSSIKDVLFSEIIYEGNYDAEYYPLLNVAVAQGIVSANEYTAFLLDTQRVVETSRYETLVKRGYCADNNQTQAEAKRFANTWLHKALYLLDKPNRTDKAQELLENQVATNGDITFQTRRIGEPVTITGPNSLKTKDEMLEMGPAQLLEWLSTWQPTQNQEWQLITPNGQAYEITALIAEKPDFFNESIGNVMLLRPRYQRAVIEGWKSALENGLSVPLDGFLTLALHISQQDDHEVINNKFVPYDDDKSFELAKKSVVRAITTVLDEKTNLDTASFNQLLSCLKNMLDSSLCVNESEDSFNNDPMTGSLNVLTPMTLTALEHWIGVFPEGSEDALELLESYLPSKGKTQQNYKLNIVALAYGYGRLVHSAEDWLCMHYDELFGTAENASEEQALMLTAILVLYSPSRTLQKSLERAMINALTNSAASYELKTNWEPTSGACMQLVGNWIYIGNVFGTISSDDNLMRAWRKKATAEQLGKSLRQVSRAASYSEALTPEVKQRLEALWDYHLEDLALQKGPEALDGISDIINSDKYEVAWWGPRAVKQLCSGAANDNFLITEDKILELSAYDPAIAVDLLSAMAEREKRIHFSLYDQVAVPVLKNALISSGGVVTEKIERCMNLLARKANLTHLDEELGLQ